MSTASLSRQRLMPNYSTASPTSKGKQNATEAPLEPCAATSSLFLYADGPTVICLRHDTLAVDRKFQKHTEDIQFICVDNVSERGAGRLVVTYDIGRTAIVWDLVTGEQISRFASYQPLTVGAWMRNGNLAFGNEKGEVILFEPATSEHVSARTIFDPITAIAPSADCKTYAIGYRNGSILLAALQPSFTILHTLTTSRSPSPIAGLLWHASSSKQKSDMLASHTVDGDLRVWSVAKAPSTTAPRVIRALRRSESYVPSRHWISWSKNGRILQFSNGETWAWDVRTKDVTYEAIPTADSVRGVAAYGPTGTLFTISTDLTVQQLDVESAQLISRIRHPPDAIPQTPPPQDFTQLQSSESEGDLASPRGQSRLEAYAAEAASFERNRTETPRSTHNRDDSFGSPRKFDLASPTSKTTRTTTTMSFGAQSALPRDLYSPISTKSDRKGSRLRQEIIRSPEERPIPELFPFVRARLSDVPYRQPKTVDEKLITPDGLRKQMLSVVFGWDDDIQSLILDELRRLPNDSPHAAYLAKWLDSSSEETADAISSSAPNNPLDWVRLALGSVSDSQGAKHIAQVFVEKLLTHGDAHAAVAVLLASGDYDDAIEVYVSRNHHMEAVLLTCLLMPTDWQRQSFLVRKWGEYAVQSDRSQNIIADRNLAIRCFSCAGVESTEPWTSPRAQTAVNVASPVAPTLQPNVYHKIMERRGLQDNASPVGVTSPSTSLQTSGSAESKDPSSASSLKLVTSFAGKDQYKFPGLMSSDGTPVNYGLPTPIADSAAPRSALSPIGHGPSYKGGNMRSLNSVVAARTGTPNSSRIRLPSIGETPIDVDTNMPQMPRPLNTRAPPTPADSGSDKEKERVKHMPMDNQRIREEMPLLLTPAVYEPPELPIETPQTAVAARSTSYFPEDTPDRDRSGKRAGSRSRKPDGLSIRMFPVTEEIQREHPVSSNYGDSLGAPSTSGSGTMHFDIGDLTTPPHTGNSYSSYKSAQSPSVTGRSLDQYISSLEQAQYYKGRPRGNSASSKQSRDDPSVRRRQGREPTADARGRGEARNIPAPKRSPSSPVPMNSEELRLYSASVESFDSTYLTTMPAAQKLQTTAYSMEKEQPQQFHEERPRQRSRSRQPEGKARTSSRARSRRPSPDRNNSYRGRSKSRREDSAPHSPSSPEPMLPAEEDQNLSNTDPALRFVAQNRSRLNSDTGRRRDRSVSKQRQASPDRKSSRMRSRSRQPEPIDTSIGRKNSISGRSEVTRRRAESSVDVNRGVRDQDSISFMDEMRPQSSRPDYERPKTSNSQHVPGSIRTKELAQAELEARRLSLARRPSAPAVPFPGQFGAHGKSISADFPPSLHRAQTDTSTVTRQNKSPHPSSSENNLLARSRPTTPAAMKSVQQQSNVPNLPNNGEILGSSVYLPAKTYETWPITPSNFNVDSYIKVDVPQDMPKHKYYDANIGTSRTPVPSSRRAASRDRGVSRERQKNSNHDVMVVTLGEDEDDVFIPVSYGPPVVPELQHLAMPPPPPPPPAPPKNMSQMGGLRIQTSDLDNAASVPLPASAYPGEPSSAFPIDSSRHRRGKSGGDNQLVGKIRGFAGRMRSESRGRSSSRPRDNPSRSPLNEDLSPPYETIIHPTQQAHQQLATVIEGR